MKKTVLLLILCLTLYVNSWTEDREIAEQLLQYYMSEDLDLEDLDKVMEFDNENSIALIERVKLTRNEISLYTIKELLEKSNLITEYSKIMYMDTLYQLKDYAGVILFYTENDFSTDLPVSFYYRIINSYIYLDDFDRAIELFSLYKSYFNKTVEFLELEYLLFRSRVVLDQLMSQEEYSVLIKLYNRDQINDELLELYLYRIIHDLNENIIGNYKFLSFITSNYSLDYNGIMYLDNNSDSIIDTELVFNNNIVLSKKIDMDQDNIEDYTLQLESGLPQSIRFSNKEVFFKTYPYLDTVYICDVTDKKYKLSDKKYRYHINNPITNNPSLEIFDTDVNKLTVDWIEEYSNNILTRRYFYLNKSDYLIFEDYRDGIYYMISHYIDGVLYRSLMDLDYDTIFDLYEQYDSDSKVLSAYSKNGDPLNIDKLEIHIERDSDFLKEISFNWNSYIEY